MSSCSVCLSAQRTQVDAALIGGDSVRSVATAFGVSKSAVERHKNGHLKARLTAQRRKASAPAPSNVPLASPQEMFSVDRILGRLARSLDRLEEAAQAAADDGLYQGLAAVSSQLTRSLETVCRVQGLFAEKAVTAPASGFGIIINLPSAPAPMGLRESSRMESAPANNADPAVTVRFDFDALSLVSTCGGHADFAES